jgi:hypothetical protein
MDVEHKVRVGGSNLAPAHELSVQTDAAPSNPRKRPASPSFVAAREDKTAKRARLDLEDLEIRQVSVPVSPYRKLARIVVLVL